MVKSCTDKTDTARLLVTSGDGPRECRRAVSLVLARITTEAAKLRVNVEETLSTEGPNQDPASAILRLSGKDASEIAKRWPGTIRWTCQSPFRPHHKRKNWFVGVFALATERDQTETLSPSDLKFETFRAGGPGGQHQNTTDSAVRLTHLPTGLSVVARDERSQHRNRAAALNRLHDRLYLLAAEADAGAKSSENLLHRQLERGNATLSFKGPSFVEG